ncbi:hypothetical protein DFJ77DRAFT_454704 [Powellomyces hirtus]|nr:hypothetical protein DFJ77DRAFT_454704 [Powellomyces hirtus]
MTPSRTSIATTLVLLLAFCCSLSLAIQVPSSAPWASLQYTNRARLARRQYDEAEVVKPDFLSLSKGPSHFFSTSGNSAPTTTDDIRPLSKVRTNQRAEFAHASAAAPLEWNENRSSLRKNVVAAAGPDSVDDDEEEEEDEVPQGFGAWDEVDEVDDQEDEPLDQPDRPFSEVVFQDIDVSLSGHHYRAARPVANGF